MVAYTYMYVCLQLVPSVHGRFLVKVLVDVRSALDIEILCTPLQAVKVVVVPRSQTELILQTALISDI